jgi:hypothetical protein
MSKTKEYVAGINHYGVEITGVTIQMSGVENPTSETSIGQRERLFLICSSIP